MARGGGPAGAGRSAGKACGSTGKPLREFLHVDDLADALISRRPDCSAAEERGSVGIGGEMSIRELAEIIAKVVGFTSRFVFNTENPKRTPRELFDVSKFDALGWRASIALRPGIASAYRGILGNIAGSDVNDTPAQPGPSPKWVPRSCMRLARGRASLC